jgi:phospholipid/cholesterol/gamma-HCH transport system substrate-binding protein
MLRRSTKIQLILFVIITLLGITYVSANYVGLTKGLIGPDSCTVHADFADSGGIFSSAEVTYRGVAVGKVTGLRLIDNGVQVDLSIDNCKGKKIPASTSAAVSDRSVIGEQYVNLVPSKNSAPYLESGSTIPMSRTTIPVSAQLLLTNLDDLVNSVDTNALRTVITELGAAFNQRGADLARLLDSSNDLLQAAEANLPQTISLLDNSATVLDRQLAEAQPLASFAHSLNLLSQQLKTSNGDITHLLTDAPGDLDVVRKFVLNNQTDLGAVIANLASTGRLLVRHLDGIEEIFELYPALAAGGPSVIDNGIGGLGLISSPQYFTTPADCGDPRKGSEGYQGTTIRKPSDLRPAAPNVAARCTAPASSGTNIRGSAHVPGGDPISTSGGGVAYPRGTTANTVTVDTGLNQAGLLGDKAWLAMLTESLH